VLAGDSLGDLTSLAAGVSSNAGGAQVAVDLKQTVTLIRDWYAHKASRPGSVMEARLDAAELLGVDAEGLERTAGQWVAMGRPIDAAETLAMASRAVRGSGATREAARLVADGLALLGPCEGAVVAGLLTQVANGSVLSTRETEIARLASNGLTNRGIAERLVLSERTVESHLYRVFAKLGITTRDEMADRLVALGIA
jgi:DNA-binding NarL/FixJ family response regulator